MTKRTTTAPAQVTDSQRQLAALATLMALMQTASKLSGELDALANEVGGSLDEISKATGIDFWDVHNKYVAETNAEPRRERQSFMRAACSRLAELFTPLKASRAG